MRASTFVAIAALAAVSSAANIPDKFIGSWEVGESENFDEYLSAKGYGFFTRQMAKLATLTKVLTKKPDGSYNYKILSTKKNLEWDNIKPEVEFEAEYLDDKMHKIKIWYDTGMDKLIEKHIQVEDPNEVDVYDYKINPDGKMQMHMEYKGIHCNRFYKKTA